MRAKISKELAKHRLEQAEKEIVACKALCDLKLYKTANSRAYYSIFYSIRAVLALEPIDFKRHKDVTAYFNKNYIKTEIFPKEYGHRIIEAFNVRDDSDYDDEFVVKPEVTQRQIETAEELIKLVEEYINKTTN